MSVSRSEFIAKQILDIFFSKYRNVDNYHPRWLGGLELDRYYPDIRVGIEFQGGQHYRYIPGMQKNPEDFKKQLRFDVTKEQLAHAEKVRIYYLNLFDLTADRIRTFISQIVRENNLEGINLYKEVDETLLKEADWLSRTKKRRRDRDPLWMRAIRNILKGL